MSAKTMAEVIREAVEFTPYWTNGGLNEDPYENAAAALTAAGFGLVADAKAEALEEAAAIAGRPENRWWTEGQNRAKWLRLLAAELRTP